MHFGNPGGWDDEWRQAILEDTDELDHYESVERSERRATRLDKSKKKRISAKKVSEAEEDDAIAGARELLATQAKTRGHTSTGRTIRRPDVLDL